MKRVPLRRVALFGRLLLLPVPVRRDRPVRYVPRRRRPRHPPQPLRLAITRAQLLAPSSTANSATYDTASITPTASRLVLMLTRGHWTTAGARTLTVTSNTGLNLTWSQVTSNNWTTIASPTDGLWIHGALSGATPGTGTVHLAFSTTQSGFLGEIIELAGVDLSGGTVASCIVQSGSGSSDTAGTTLTDTFGAAVNTANAVIACAGQANKNGTLYTWNNSFTESLDVGSGESTAYNLTTGFILSGFTGTSHTITSTTSATWGFLGCEVKVAAAGPAPLTADPGSYSVTGVAASPIVDHLLSSAPGSYGVTGQAAGTIADRLLTAAIGSYAVTGADASELVDHILSGDVGIYAITGSDVVFVAPGGETILTALPGSYAVTGVDAAALVDRMLAGAVGAYSLSGADVQMLVDHLLSAAPGTYQVTGASAAEIVDRLLASLPGGYTLTGVAALLEQTAYVGPEQPATYAITGAPATLVYSALGPVVELETQSSRLRWARLQ